MMATLTGSCRRSVNIPATFSHDKKWSEKGNKKERRDSKINNDNKSDELLFLFDFLTRYETDNEGRLWITNPVVDW